MYYYDVFYFVENRRIRKGRERNGKELEQEICLPRVYNLGAGETRHNQKDNKQHMSNGINKPVKINKDLQK